MVGSLTYAIYLCIAGSRMAVWDRFFPMYRGKLHFVICLHTNIGTCPAVNFKPTWKEIINFVPSCWIHRPGFTPSKALGTGHILKFRPALNSCLRQQTLISGTPYPWGRTYHVKQCLDFSFVFSAPLPAWRNLFSESGIFCGGRYQPGSTGIFWPAEPTSQPVIISKKWKKFSSALHRESTWVQAPPWFLTCSIGLPGSGTDLNSWKGFYSGTSTIQNKCLHCWFTLLYIPNSIVIPKSSSNKAIKGDDSFLPLDLGS